MLLSETTKTKWNSKTKKYYVELGYAYTKMGDEFDVKIEDLKKSSRENVVVKCDYNEEGCEGIVNKEYQYYTESHLITDKDCCNNENCKRKKQQESTIKKYGVDNYFKLANFTGKNNYEFKDTNITCLYCGKVVHRNESEIIKYKRNFCCNECKNDYIRKNSTVEEHLKIRNSLEYKKWRNSVIDRDHKTCQCCSSHNHLEAHHLNSFSDNEELRLDINNGITLCENCHSFERYGSFHNIYGSKGFTKEDLFEYIKRYKSGEFDDARKLNQNYIIPKVKKCTRCDRVMPNTIEFYHKDKYSKDELTCACKECRVSKKITEEMIVQGLNRINEEAI